MAIRWQSGGSTGSRMVKQGYAFVRAYNGIVWPVADGRRGKAETCPHNHRSPSQARKCAERTAARWNRAKP